MHVNNYEAIKLLSNGLFAVNKVKGLTSAHVLEILKTLIIKDLKSTGGNLQLKLGHGGTLDQTATGVIVVGTGLGCKLLPKLLHGNKRYSVTGHLGVATDTYNETGTIVLETNYGHITREMMNTALNKFAGHILQVPPKYSALKLDGQRIADLTRAGIEVSMKPRPVFCHSVRCTAFTPPTFKLDVSCGGGFYVRSLVSDLGIALHSCAHVTELHRSQHGPFNEEDMLLEPDWTLGNILNAIRMTREKYDRLTGSFPRKKIKQVWDDR